MFVYVKAQIHKYFILFKTQIIFNLHNSLGSYCALNIWRTKHLKHWHRNSIKITNISIPPPTLNMPDTTLRIFQQLCASSVFRLCVTRVCQPVRSWSCVCGKVQTEPPCIICGNNPPVLEMDCQPEAQLWDGQLKKTKVLLTC